MPPKREWVPEAIRFEQDPVSGAEVEQLTSQPVTSTNIYCEQRYATADGSRIALARTPFDCPTQLWVCDMRSLRVRKAAEGWPTGANPVRGAVYFVTSDSQNWRLMRLDLKDMAVRELAALEGPPPSCGAISPDERWFVCGPFTVKDNVFGLRRIDLSSGQSHDLCQIEDMFNPHLQFEPTHGRQVLVQINRGGRLNLPNGGVSLTGELGATLCLADVQTGHVTPLPAGRPHTPPITGHECWLGATGRVLFTAGAYNVSASAHVTFGQLLETEKHMPAGAVYSAAAGESESAIVARGLLFNHLAASDDGRFFIADDHTTGHILVGSVKTGRWLRLCDSHTRQGSCQYSHAHAYMTPDNAFVIFNSIVTGVAQVFAARVPPGFLDSI